MENLSLKQAVAALKFLSSRPRPSGGQEQFNSEYLLQIAGELEVASVAPKTGRGDLVGKTVVFTDQIEVLEIEVDEGMKMKVVSVKNHNNGILEVEFDSNGFEGHNFPLMQANYYDEVREPTLTALQSGNWPKSGRHVGYFEADANLNEFFGVCEDETATPTMTRSGLEVQILADIFNREYVKACRTSQPKDWYQSALTARQLVGEMAKAKIVTDNFQEVHDEIFAQG